MSLKHTLAPYHTIFLNQVDPRTWSLGSVISLTLCGQISPAANVWIWILSLEDAGLESRSSYPLVLAPSAQILYLALRYVFHAQVIFSIRYNWLSQQFISGFPVSMLPRLSSLDIWHPWNDQPPCPCPCVPSLNFCYFLVLLVHAASTETVHLLCLRQTKFIPQLRTDLYGDFYLFFLIGMTSW